MAMGRVLLPHGRPCRPPERQHPIASSRRAGAPGASPLRRCQRRGAFAPRRSGVSIHARAPTDLTLIRRYHPPSSTPRTTTTTWTRTSSGTSRPRSWSRGSSRCRRPSPS